MKGKLKSLFTRNIGMKLVSIVIAFLVWIAIINLSNPTITRTISDIPIEWRNESIVTSETASYATDAAREVTIRIRGVRAEIENLSADDFLAYVDFSEMSNVYAVPVHVEAKTEEIASIMEITKQSMTMMPGKLETKSKETVDITVLFVNVPEKYYPLCNNKSYNSMTISGAESVVDSVSRLVASVDLKNSTQDVKQREVKLTAFDSNDNVINLREIGIPDHMSTILVDVDMLPIVDMEIQVDQAGITAAKGFGIASVEFTSSVSLAGKAENIAKVGDRIVIQYVRRNLMESVEDNDVSVENYLPKDVYLVQENKKITVKIQVERLGQKSFNAKTADISVRNLSSLLTSEFAEEEITFSVYDLNKNLVNLVETDLGLYVDLAKETETGTISVELHSTMESVESSLREDSVAVTVVLGNAEEE